MKSVWLPLSIVVLACGCGQAEITQPPIMVTPATAGAVGLDVYARDRAQGNPVPQFRGQESIQVRTFGNLDGSGYAEVAGADCALDSGLYRAAFQSPANIAVPDYGPDSPAVFIRCTVAATTGQLSGSVTLDAFNLTAAERQSSAFGTGILGAIIIGAVAAANVNPAADEFAYPQAAIQLR